MHERCSFYPRYFHATDELVATFIVCSKGDRSSADVVQATRSAHCLTSVNAPRSPPLKRQATPSADLKRHYTATDGQLKNEI